MEDFIFAPLVLLIGLGIHGVVLRNHSAHEGRLLTVSFAMHMVAGFAQVWLTRYYFRGGDMLNYWENGVEVANVLRDDLPRFFPEVVRAFLQRDYEFPVPIFGTSSTQSMSSVAAVLLFALGDSLYAAVLAVSLLSFSSKVLLYRALRHDFSEEMHRAVLIGATLLPTAVFWSCGLLKEPIIMCSVGPLVLGLRWLMTGHRRSLALLMIGAAALPIALIKPYVLMTISVAGAAFYLWSRMLSRDAAAMKPFAIVTAALIATGGLVLGNRFFTKSEASAVDSFARQRDIGARVEGGSNFSIEGAQPVDEAANRSLSREVLLAPFAIFTSLFRPLLFEARNAVQLANALEATVLLAFFAQLLRRRGVMGTFADIRASPTLVFCALFTLALALGTGLSTTNMGTLSRYRAPMMPFYFVLLMVLRDRATRAGATQSPAPVAPLRAGAQARRA